MCIRDSKSNRGRANKHNKSRDGQPNKDSGRRYPWGESIAAWCQHGHQSMESFWDASPGQVIAIVTNYAHKKREEDKRAKNVNSVKQFASLFGADMPISTVKSE